MEAPGIAIHSILRFGNYFVITGTDEKQPEAVHFEFSGTPDEAKPEYSFGRDRDSQNGKQHDFIHLFWINDGYQLEISDDKPLKIINSGAIRSENGNTSFFCGITESDHAALQRSVESFDLPELWKNRLLWEIVSDYTKDGPAPQLLPKALQKLGWAETDSEIGRLFYVKEGKTDTREYLRFQTTCIPLIDADRLPDALRHDFREQAAALELCQTDIAFIGSVASQLKRIATADACEFILRSLHSLPIRRQDLVTLLPSLLPLNSKWWICNVLQDGSIGPEQAADALNALGAAAFTQEKTLLAEVFFTAASGLSSESQSPLWNTGFLHLSQRNISKARECFEKITRYHANRSIFTLWPRTNGDPWPQSTLDPDLFSLPDGTEKWPRISIVTPSFNQGQFIEETILSVLNQNYPNLQYIVVDGDSTDDTRSVLERYRDRIDHLIIEPDDGQTQAINKGLRLADGEILAWLNSDDMYAPGALHQIAIRWLSSRADVIAGICAEHRDKSFALINKPSARTRDFTPQQLARIFPDWFVGAYFFQPETFFTRNILNRAGLLDESLHFAMDYDLWMRFAMAGARLEIIDWPCAFFRLHDAQKTSNMVESIAEQCAIRNRHHPLEVNAERRSRIESLLSALRFKQNPPIAFFGKYFESLLNDVARMSQSSCRIVLPTSTNDDALDSAGAAVILIGSRRHEIDLLKQLRASYPDLLLIGWFLELEIDPRANHDAAMLVDIIVPTDPWTGDYLRNETALMGPAIRSDEFPSFLGEISRLWNENYSNFP